MKLDLVVAGFIFHEDKVLLIHHNKLDLWLPVGGHMDQNETPDEALIREIQEETGLNISFIHPGKNNTIKTTNLATPFNVNRHNVGDHDHCCLNYICKAVNPEQLQINKELKNFGWFTKEDLNKDIVPPDIRTIALEAFELINRPSHISHINP